MPPDTANPGEGTPAGTQTPEQLAAAALEPGDNEQVTLKDGKTVVDTPSEKLFNKAYVDRLRETADRAQKEAKTLRDTQTEATRKTAEEQGNFKKLYDDLKTELDQVKNQHGEELSVRDRRIVRAEIRSIAVEAGILDPRDLDLLDYSKLKLADDGTVEGADESIGNLKKDRPHLFKGTKETVKRDAEGKPVAPKGDVASPLKDARDMSAEEFKSVWAKLKGRG